jgi:hypothetical protein
MSGEAAELSETLGETPARGDQADARDAGFMSMLLPRHGRRPARFLGREMLRADSRAAARAGRLPLWSDIQIYELYAGGFVTAVRHLRAEDDRAFFQDVWLVQDPWAVMIRLRQHDIAAATPGEDYVCDTASARAWQAFIGAIFGAEPPI